MKLIKFNLPLNGTSIGTLEQLQRNFTAEVLDHFRSGKLVKWLQVRNLSEQAGKLDKLYKEDNIREIQLFKKINEIFGIEIDEPVAELLLVEHKRMASPTAKTIDDELATITASLAKKEIDHQKEIDKIYVDIEIEMTKFFEEKESVYNAEIKNHISKIIEINGKYLELAKNVASIVADPFKIANPKTIVDLSKLITEGLNETVATKKEFTLKLRDISIKLNEINKI